jgi:hypothetical protein
VLVVHQREGLAELVAGNQLIDKGDRENDWGVLGVLSHLFLALSPLHLVLCPAVEVEWESVQFCSPFIRFDFLHKRTSGKTAVIWRTNLSGLSLAPLGKQILLPYYT